MNKSLNSKCAELETLDGRRIAANPAMKEENEAEAASDADLFRLALGSLEAKSRRVDDLPTELKKLIAVRDAHNKNKAGLLNWRKLAKLAAHDLKAFTEEILLAAQTCQTRFFIDLGKCLSGQMKSGYDKLDVDMALLLSRHPSIKVKYAVRELVRLNHPRINEENFRVRKQRLKDLGRAVHERNKALVVYIDEFGRGTLEVFGKEA